VTCSHCKRETHSVWGPTNPGWYRCWDCYARWDGKRWVYHWEQNTDHSPPPGFSGFPDKSGDAPESVTPGEPGGASQESKP
jgi:hypothetical protein